MTTDSTVLAFQHPDRLDDRLTSVLRDGARLLLAQAIEAEAEAFLASMKDERLADGRARVVRHGHGPERTIQTGIGPVPVKRAKLRDRGAEEAGGERITFSSAILPKWARRSKSLEALLPVLYLRGISTGDFQEALSALLGNEAPNLSPSVIARLKEDWTVEYERWHRRDLSAKRYVYIWADGVYLQARMESTAACMLVVIGATPEGRKELVGFHVGARESTQSWRELLVDLKARGLSVAPEIAGDIAFTFLTQQIGITEQAFSLNARAIDQRFTAFHRLCCEPLLFITGIEREIKERDIKACHHLFFVERAALPQELNKGVGFIPLRRITEYIHGDPVRTIHQVIEHGGCNRDRHV